MTGIGVISLAGIVVNNNIVLIDTHDRLRRQISDPVQAILLTGAQRLRPVLLTSVTTILGLMPMVLQINIDFVSREVSFASPSSQWWVQLATAIAAGLGRLIEDEGLRHKLRARGLERARVFSWERTAQAVRRSLGAARAE